MTTFGPKLGARAIFPHLQRDELNAFQDEWEIELPQDYKDFLMHFNGATFQAEVVVFPTQPVDNHSRHAPRWDCWTRDNRRSIDDGIGSLAFLYGLGQPSNIASLWASNSGYGFEQWTPYRFLAIGEIYLDIGRIALSLDGEDRGHIYCWIAPEDIPRPGENCPNMDFMWWIAPNFGEFWASLREMSEEEYFEWN